MKCRIALLIHSGHNCDDALCASLISCTWSLGSHSEVDVVFTASLVGEGAALRISVLIIKFVQVCCEARKDIFEHLATDCVVRNAPFFHGSTNRFLGAVVDALNTFQRV